MVIPALFNSAASFGSLYERLSSARPSRSGFDFKARDEINAKLSCPIIGNSLEVAKVVASLDKIAKSNCHVLITGETGTGKELIAQALHELSPRSRATFISTNCAAIAGNLVGTELFGNERGSFTDAKKRIGRFEEAKKGTIFLDEIGELPIELQPYLLRVLSEGQFFRIGSNTPVKTSARVIAATNVDLKAAIDRGAFREDLYQRLNVIRVDLPALRDRKDDIALLANYLAAKNVDILPEGKSVVHFSEGAINKLESYNYPGNIRELENIVKRALVFSQTEVISEDDIIFDLEEAARRGYELRKTNIQNSNANLLIVGETGAGKGHLAKELANQDPKRDKVVTIDAGSIPKDLIESTLFGHTRGSFTGAVEDKEGLIDGADKGILIVDEIGNLPMDAQSRLLRFLQNGEVVKVGENKPRKIDARVFALTNMNLAQAVLDGKFREDLFYRLNVVPILVPPLRDRRDEIPGLVSLSLANANNVRGDGENVQISEAANRVLLESEWSGNIRELQTAIQAAVLLSDPGGIIEPEDINTSNLSLPSAPTTFSAALDQEKLPNHPAIVKCLVELVSCKTGEKQKRDYLHAKLKCLIYVCNIGKRTKITMSDFQRITNYPRATFFKLPDVKGIVEFSRMINDELGFPSK